MEKNLDIGENDNINLKSDYENLLSYEEKNILEKLNGISNKAETDKLKEQAFYNLSLKDLLNNFLKTWNLIFIELTFLYKNFKTREQNKKDALFKNNYWWNNIKIILKEIFYILTKGDRLIYVGIMLIVISFFIYFLLISS